MVGITTLGEYGALCAIIGIVTIALDKHRAYGIAIFVGIALAFVVGDVVLKNVIARPRLFLLDPTLATTVINHPTASHAPGTFLSLIRGRNGDLPGTAGA